MEYRGIQLDENLKLYNKNGEFNLKTKDSLDKLADKLAEDSHILKSEYKSDIEKVLIDFCCGHKSNWILPSSYKQGTKCPKCHGGINKKKKEAEMKLIKKVVFNKHSLLSEYKNSKEKVLIDFNCGHEPHWLLPNSYKHGLKCPKCEMPSLIKAKKEFFEMIEKNNHKSMSEYVLSDKKVLIDFNCGHEPHWLTPNTYKRGIGCPKCNREKSDLLRITKAKKAFIKLVEKNGHKMLSKYKRTNSKVLIDFDCKHEPHWITPNTYKMGKRCPHCNESKGEKIIAEWLDKNNIEYHREYRLPNKLWRYDFFIPAENLIVEVQGLQHFRFVEYFHKTKENFYKQANEYNSKWAYAALALGYEWMEVDYSEGKPELALERFLKAFNDLRRKNEPIKQKEEQLSLF